MKKIVIYLTVLFAFLSCKKEVSAIKVVSVKEAKEVLVKENIQVIDVRTPEELQAGGFIKGAKNINFKSDTFNTEINKLDKQKPVFVYCQGGVRSASAAKKMKALGFEDIYDLEGGFSKWTIESPTMK